jgi:adenine phosphoribosyltransferase
MMAPATRNKAELERRVRAAVRDVPDFPKAGILFKDITPVLGDPVLFAEVTDAMAAPYQGAGVSHVVAVESRGFILGAPIAQQLGAAFVPVRKPGKLPHRTIRQDYALEYGSDAVEMHADALGGDARVLIVDDVLATGGTAAATAVLCERAGARVVGFSFLIVLAFLGGDRRLDGARIETVVSY